MKKIRRSGARCGKKARRAGLERRVASPLLRVHVKFKLEPKSQADGEQVLKQNHDDSPRPYPGRRQAAPGRSHHPKFESVHFTQRRPQPGAVGGRMRKCTKKPSATCR
jgi:hypothetical protein